ncbi:MAG: proteasome assembly chaperone family protein [Candidatus Nanohalobium sp.]
MVDISVVNDEVDLEGYYLVEGLPGVGLVAKIASDFLIQKLEMEPYAEIYCDDFSSVTVFERDNPELKAAVRVFIDRESKVAVLKSDVPVSAESKNFMDSVTDWMGEEKLKPVFQIGLPVDVEGEGEKYMFHVKNGDIPGMNNVEFNDPPVAGGISGPTGALLEQALKKDMDVLALVIESGAFPDPEGSKQLIDEGIGPVTGIDIDTGKLKEKADQIREQKKKLAENLRKSPEKKASEAYPREMYT